MGSFSQVLRQVKEWLILELYETIRVPDIVAYPIVFICFMIAIGKEESSSYEIWPCVSVFSRLSPFPQVLGQFKL